MHNPKLPNIRIVLLPTVSTGATHKLKPSPSIQLEPQNSFSHPSEALATSWFHPRFPHKPVLNNIPLPCLLHFYFPFSVVVMVTVTLAIYLVAEVRRSTLFSLDLLLSCLSDKPVGRWLVWDLHQAWGDGRWAVSPLFNLPAGPLLR